VGPETSDDAGVYLHRGSALVATADFITPVCDDPRRFGRVAAANALSDVYAMGGEPLFALNLCCFPEADVPRAALSAILLGAGEALKEADAALLGGHTVRDTELKFGLAVIGHADPQRLLTNAGARPGDRLLLTKPLGTGVLLNAFRFSKLDEGELEPALVEMERLNAVASRLALKHDARAATDVTGFALVGHALEMARGSGVTLEIDFDRLPVYEHFYRLAKKGISTGCTDHNKAAAEGQFQDRRGLDRYQLELLFDPQTSGGLLLSVPEASTPALLQALLASGHRAAEIGRVTAGKPAFAVV
jgi:selenide,water dikinase